MQKKHATLMSLAGASIALLALVGCSPAQSSDSANDSKPTASAEQKSDASGAKDSKDKKSAEDEVFVPEEKTLECVDGYASSSDSNTILTLEGDCAAVEITGVNSLISINGTVDSLSVGGSINKVITVSANNITFLADSSGNVVESAGEPAVTENGAENEVVAPE